MSHGVPLAARSFARSIAANKILSGRRVIQTGNLLAGGGAFSCLSVRYAPFRVVFVFHRLFVTFSFYSPILSVFLIFPPVSPFVCFSFFLFSFFFRLSPSFRIRRRESRWRHFGPGRTGGHLHQVALRRVIQVCAVPVDHFTCYCSSLFCFFVVADTTNQDKKRIELLLSIYLVASAVICAPSDKCGRRVEKYNTEQTTFLPRSGDCRGLESRPR